ncbi:YdcF family protein [Azospirillum sp. B4]|uniref:YdcF family protein n=1 Tax=Azospirillum sp. B4 TaxID=95605 RepID=UPI00034BADF3|nr:YdcF family protein [Azospirillum sp. B4]
MMTPLEFFTLSKIGWYLVAPSHVLVWVALAAAVLAARRHPAAVAPATACAVTVLALLTCPVGNWALRPLEGLYPRPAEPATIDGILVLGEGLNGAVLRDRGVPGVGPDGGTLLAAAALARRHPEARVVFSGGSGDLGADGPPAAEVARHVLTGLGLDETRVAYEARSRTTLENLVLAKRMVQPAPEETWLLVAAAYHMPRAMLSASRVGWRMVPWPSDYLTTARGPETHLSLAANLAHLDLAAHEGLGLLVYRLTQGSR